MKKLIITPIAALVTALVVFALLTKPASNQPGSETNPPPPPNEEKNLTTLFFAGDIMLSRNVEDRMAKANDYTLPFRQVAEFIKNTDIAFANLESPFNNQGRHFVPNSLVFNANPKSVEGLTYAGLDILSTANNHSFDQGQKGLAYTIDLLTKNNIIPVGTGVPAVDVTTATIEKNEIVFGFLAYSYTAYNDGGKSTSPMIGNFNDMAQMKQDVIKMKGHFSDVVIVSMHAGTEYTRTPNQAQIDFARAAIDAGADIVVGHHPHWIQTIEIYKGKPIFYSLGNFVFDQMFSQDTKEGLTALVTYKHTRILDASNQTAGEDILEIIKVELKPVIIENFCCARWANTEETKSILNKINPGTKTPVIIDNSEVTDDWKNTIKSQN